MYKHAILTILCLMGKTDTFGLYDDSTDIKIIDTGPDLRKSEKEEKRLKFLSKQVENYCFGSEPCSRKTFQTLIPETGKSLEECGLNISTVRKPDEHRSSISNFVFFKKAAKQK